MFKCHQQEKDDVSLTKSLLIYLLFVFNLVTKDESETPVATPPQFTIQKLDPTSVLIEAVIPPEEPAIFEDVYDVYSKNETIDDDDWTKVCHFLMQRCIYHSSFIRLRNISHKSHALTIT
jgi:hypothetical protein